MQGLSCVPGRPNTGPCVDRSPEGSLRWPHDHARLPLGLVPFRTGAGYRAGPPDASGRLPLDGCRSAPPRSGPRGWGPHEPVSPVKDGRQPCPVAMTPPPRCVLTMASDRCACGSVHDVTIDKVEVAQRQRARAETPARDCRATNSSAPKPSNELRIADCGLQIFRRRASSVPKSARLSNRSKAHATFRRAARRSA